MLKRTRRFIILVIVLVMSCSISVWMWTATTPEGSICEGGACTIQFEEDGYTCHVTRDLMGNIVSSGCP